MQAVDLPPGDVPGLGDASARLVQPQVSAPTDTILGSGLNNGLQVLLEATTMRTQGDDRYPRSMRLALDRNSPVVPNVGVTTSNVAVTDEHGKSEEPKPPGRDDGQRDEAVMEMSAPTVPSSTELPARPVYQAPMQQQHEPLYFVPPLPQAAQPPPQHQHQPPPPPPPPQQQQHHQLQPQPPPPAAQPHAYLYHYQAHPHVHAPHPQYHHQPAYSYDGHGQPVAPPQPYVHYAQQPQDSYQYGYTQGHQWQEVQFPVSRQQQQQQPQQHLYHYQPQYVIAPQPQHHEQQLQYYDPLQYPPEQDSQTDPQKQRVYRCDNCKFNKIRCDGDGQGACTTCDRRSLMCVYTGQANRGQPKVVTNDQKRRRSCDACRISRVKCDTNVPSCTRCQRRGQPCVYRLRMPPGYDGPGPIAPMPDVEVQSGDSSQGDEETSILAARNPYRGVTWAPSAGKWRADHYNGRKRIQLGFFDDAADAALAYIRACRERPMAQTKWDQERISPFPGVSWDVDRRQWRADYTTEDGTSHYLGHYLDPLDAAETYIRASRDNNPVQAPLAQLESSSAPPSPVLRPSFSAACMQCKHSKVKCNKSNPCTRCIRLKLPCKPGLRPQGRPFKRMDSFGLQHYDESSLGPMPTSPHKDMDGFPPDLCYQFSNGTLHSEDYPSPTRSGMMPVPDIGIPIATTNSPFHPQPNILSSPPSMPLPPQARARYPDEHVQEHDKAVGRSVQIQRDVSGGSCASGVSESGQALPSSKSEDSLRMSALLLMTQQEREDIDVPQGQSSEMPKPPGTSIEAPRPPSPAEQPAAAKNVDTVEMSAEESTPAPPSSPPPVVTAPAPVAPPLESVGPPAVLRLTRTSSSQGSDGKEPVAAGSSNEPPTPPPIPTHAPPTAAKAGRSRMTRFEHSDFYGVKLDKSLGLYRASISTPAPSAKQWRRRKEYTVGYFDNALEAAEAYDKEVKKFYPNADMHLNFPNKALAAAGPEHQLETDPEREESPKRKRLRQGIEDRPAVLEAPALHTSVPNGGVAHHSPYMQPAPEVVATHQPLGTNGTPVHDVMV